jgi:molybdopterin-guanine dinucleotide biosynthesis protein A
MGSPKAALDWHGSTLLARVTGIVARAASGPVIVVRAPGQELPALPASVQITQDAREGRGPLEGLAAGLAAIGDRAPVAYVSSTDAPLLHPAFVRRVVAACGDDVDVALPEIGGYRQPTAAAYRVALLPTLLELIGADRLKPAFLYERCRVLGLDEAALLADPALARADPGLASVMNVNEPAEYERALALPAPEITVRWDDAPRSGAAPRPQTVAAWTLGQLALAIAAAGAPDAPGVPATPAITLRLNGAPTAPDPELPLAAGDTVTVGPGG